MVAAAAASRLSPRSNSQRGKVAGGASPQRTQPSKAPKNASQDGLSFLPVLVTEDGNCTQLETNAQGAESPEQISSCTEDESVQPTMLQLHTSTPGMIWASSRSLNSIGSASPRDGLARSKRERSPSPVGPQEHIARSHATTHEKLEDISERLKRSLAIPKYLERPHPGSKEKPMVEKAPDAASPRTDFRLLPTLKFSPWAPKAKPKPTAPHIVDKRRIAGGQAASSSKVERADVMAPKTQALQRKRGARGPVSLVRAASKKKGQEPESPKEYPRFSIKRDILPVEQPIVEKRSTTVEFDLCLSLTRKFGLSADQIKEHHKEFLDLDLNNSGQLCRSEFEEAIRHYCAIPIDEDIPEHLLQRVWAQADKNMSGTLDFEEYLLWRITHEYSEEFVCSNSMERRMRKVARDHTFNIIDVEEIKGVFDHFDVDKSGIIDEEEFRQCIYQLLGASQPSDIPENKMKRYWAEIDADKSGEVHLEEFVVWYFNMLI